MVSLSLSHERHTTAVGAGLYDRELEVARAAAKAAESVLLQYFRTGIIADLKGPSDLVTQADHRSEERVRGIIAEAFPDDTVVGEEGAQPPEDELHHQRRWYVDPLDGTTNYVKGQPRWAVSVAFCDSDGEFGACAMRRPCDGEEYVATRGGGAYRNGEALVRDDDLAFADALVLIGPLAHYNAEIAEIANRSLSLRVTGSTVADLTDLAAGRGDLYLARDQGRWDIAAGTLLTREAGLIVTTMDGAVLDGPGDNVVVAPPAVHATTLDILKGV